MTDTTSLSITYNNEEIQIPVTLASKISIKVDGQEINLGDRSGNDLDAIVKRYNITSLSDIVWLPTYVFKYINFTFKRKQIRRAIERYTEVQTEKAFSYITSGGFEGLPSRYVMLQNYLINDKRGGYLHEQFLKDPVEDLVVGTSYLLDIMEQNNQSNLMTILEDVVNQKNKNMLLITGEPHSGRCKIATMLVDYISGSYSGRPRDITRQGIRDLVDHRLLHLHNDILPDGLIDEYIQLFGNSIEPLSNDSADYNKTRRHYPSVIITHNRVPWNHVSDRQKESLSKNCYALNWSQLTTDTSVERLTPFHYITALAIGNNRTQLHDKCTVFASIFVSMLNNPQMKLPTSPALDRLFKIVY
ncbi:hypothetical protein CcNV_044 [Crangon crangon nudivirus]|uniref:Uncharacterized protein n=1 Tax=Crangon crangon nudivirus TaxID=2880838 RepID=A0AAE9BZ72_9VIRU|nr:hypothetical protein QKT25_gp044 [Crangon crangon nudivirus]UBZ25528.1 hypothetical protein CcNV_044 [Crangon crangon nudivirus]